ncbi:CheR family methyltransferase [Anaerolineales bacterium HSG6]|nr:CheR family methyltransferase [Anaerolineales bacterium HSG6]
MGQFSSPKVTLNDNDYQRFRDLVLEHSGLHFPENKRVDLEIGLSKALVESSLISSNTEYDLNQYYRLLYDPNSLMGRKELKRLISILTVGETYFFRDSSQFDVLINQVLPALIKRKLTNIEYSGLKITPQLRIWSAGCATGEEPYSIAMALKEMLPDIRQWNIFILGTDINNEALERAKIGRYSSWSFREERAKQLRSKYFTNDPKTRYFQLRSDIRNMVTFQPLNLTGNSYPSSFNNITDMDLIICRNVTIYFKQETTQQVINRFYETLVKDGWLVVGHAESSLSTYRAYQARSFKGAIFYQKTGTPTSWPNSWEQENVQTRPAKQKPKQKSSPSNTLKTRSASRFKPQTPLNSRSTPKSQTTAKPQTADYYEVAQELLAEGKAHEAIEQLQKNITATPAFAPAYSLLGRAYANLGRWAEAKTACQKAIDLNQLLTDAYITLALIYQQENELQLAIDNLKKATYLDHKAPLPYFNLGMLYKSIDQQDKARRSFQVAVKLLEKLPPDHVIAGTDGEVARRLLRLSRQMMD